MEITDYPESECLLKFVEERIKKKLGAIFLFTGESGKGKSYAGVRFLEMWYKRNFNELFSLTHVCENLEQAMMLVRNFKRKGEGILIEELSVHISVRDSLTIQNKLWNKFVDTVRIKQAIIIGNCPHRSFIDKHFVLMTQAWVDCESVDFKRNIVKAHPLWLQPSPHKNEPYKHRFLDEEGMPIDICYFRKPSRELWEKYDIIKLEGSDQIFDELVLKMKADRIKQLRQLGQKFLPKRELEAYILYLNGYRAEEAAKEMRLKTTRCYYEYLKNARNRLKSPQYSVFSKLLEENQRKDKKPNENRHQFNLGAGK